MSEGLTYSLIEGGIIGAISYLVIDKIISRKWPISTQVKLLISVLVTLTVSGYNGQRRAANDQRQNLISLFDKSLADADQIIPIYKTIREIDPVGFERFRANTLDFLLRNPNVTEKEAMLFTFKAMREISGSYFRHASDVAVSNYFEQQISFLKYLNSKSPELVCKQVFPTVFGNLTPKDFTDFPDYPKFINTVQGALRSGAQKLYSGQMFLGSMYLDSFKTDFIKKYPKQMTAVSSPQQYMTAPAQKELADSIMLYYAELQRLPKTEQAHIFRFLLSGEAP
jgi:hypothetical protein